MALNPLYAALGGLATGVDQALIERKRQKERQALLEQEAAQRKENRDFQLTLQDRALANQTAQSQRELKEKLLLSGLEQGDVSAGREFDQLLGLPKQSPPEGFGQLAQPQVDLGVTGPRSEYFTGLGESMARRMGAEREKSLRMREEDAALKRRQAEADLKKTNAEIGALMQKTDKTGDKADIKDNISTIEVALNSMNKEAEMLFKRRESLDKVITETYGGDETKIPAALKKEYSGIDERLGNLTRGMERRRKRLDILREGFDVGEGQPGLWKSTNDAFQLASQIVGDYPSQTQLTKQLLRDGVFTSPKYAEVKAGEFMQLRSKARDLLRKAGRDDSEDTVTQFFQKYPDATLKDLEAAIAESE